MEDLNKLREIKILRILDMKDRGRRESIPCPFHRDTDPSLSIYPDNSFHCFGCGVNGRGAIDFLQETGATFIEVIEELKKFI